jgi:hypothetical protein
VRFPVRDRQLAIQATAVSRQFSPCRDPRPDAHARLHRIEPGVKIFQCKVQTLPDQQIEICSEADHRIEAALSEAGLRFADDTLTMYLHVVLPAATKPLRVDGMRSVMSALY